MYVTSAFPSHLKRTDFLIQPMVERRSSGPSVQATLLLRKYHSSHSSLERITFSPVSHLVFSWCAQ
jgi:hypothetical protein